jgi:hypothetical protein
MGAEFSAKFLCNLCSICWSNHRTIQSLVHFCLEFWRNLILKVATWIGLVPERALPSDVAPPRSTSSPPYPDRAHTPRRRNTPRSEASAIATVDLRLMTHASGLGRCHAACTHLPAGEPPCAIGRRPAARRHHLLAHADAPVGHEARAQPPRRVVKPILLLPFFPHACLSPHCSLPSPAISAAGELAAPLAIRFLSFFPFGPMSCKIHIKS